MKLDLKPFIDAWGSAATFRISAPDGGLHFCGVDVAPEAFISQFGKTAEGFARGVGRWREVLSLMAADARAAAGRDGNLFEAAALHFRSAADQASFVVVRDAGDRAAMRRAVQRELETARRFLPLVRGDSRIGYECSNHYFYVPQDVREKIICCRTLLDGLKSD